ncbi:DDE-type integrase/transposase/recombinase [Telmatocola sphagniphila]|uniref:DDE-type integrase/transposase/recombinase n=1 Tax=Telmatocola sphagniphila TaxID=1123043 RepID=A0A8E6F011_9BACT|nr:DDE-type integrase/transposase/recombinase [Telmatocola sphagniphila]
MKKLENRLVFDAFAIAVETRYPAVGLLAQSDRGSQYASEHYQSLLAKHGIQCSMSRRADCWDNAPMEDFFSRLKKDLCHSVEYRSRDEAKRSSSNISKYSTIKVRFQLVELKFSILPIW